MGRRISVIGATALLAVVVLVIIAAHSRPAALGRSTSRYVPMRDGVELAVSVYLPADLREGERLPVLMRTARYWREPELGWAARALIALHLMRATDLIDDHTPEFTRRRFAVLLVDARGSGASGGRRAMEYSPVEVADMGEVAAWAARQPWSNGRIGTFGISYEGNTAEMAAAANQPAIRAVMPLYDEFDNYEQINTGGVSYAPFIEEWGALVTALDHDDVCGADQVTGWRCWRDRLLTPGVRRVDGDARGTLLAQRIAEHHNVDVARVASHLEYRDDTITTDIGTFHFADFSPYGLRSRIETSKVPMMVWCGWLDGNACDGSLVRYRTFSNPQVVIIGPLSHGGSYDIDPFAAHHEPPAPTGDEQLRMQSDFFDRTLRSDTATPIASVIRYYTMGEGRWHETSTWPPAGLSPTRLYFGAAHTLSAAPASVAVGSDSYAVDYTASTGTETRWHTGIGGGDVVYPDRATEDQKLLVYTGPPLDADVEITGAPVLTLCLASSATDGAVHAYLEDVSPEGRVTYLDEGVMRLTDRKEVDPATLPYTPLGPAHSFLRSDVEPLIPGQPVTVRFSFYTTSLVLHKGHRVRVALAGTDSGIFRRYPAAGAATWTVYRDTQRASFIELPSRIVPR
jgi:putative CocE/NonD family hydrolase